jgi:hypothetical protein
MTQYSEDIETDRALFGLEWKEVGLRLGAGNIFEGKLRAPTEAGVMVLRQGWVTL